MHRLRFGIPSLLAATTLVVALQARDLPAQNPAGSPAGQATAPTSGTGLFMGVIVDALSDRPVAGSLVTLNGLPGGDVVVLTDTQGRFVFSDLPKGAYTISAAKAGYADGAFGRRRPDGRAQWLGLDDAERIGDLKIPIWKHGSIAGTIRDEAGEPMVDLPLRILIRTFVAGKRKLSVASDVRTDDRGAYRAGSLTPGEYVVVVPSIQSTAPESVVDLYRQAQAASRAGGPPDAMQEYTTSGAGNLLNFMTRSAGFRVGSFVFQPSASTSRAGAAPSPLADGRIFVYPTQYYSAARMPAQATTIALRSGEERTGVDVQLNLVPTSRLSGTVSGPDGPLMVGLALTLNSDELATDTNFETATTVSDAAGRFTFLGVPAGQYVLRVVKGPPAGLRGGPPPAFPPSAPTLSVAHPISIDASDVRDVAIRLVTGFRVTGRLEFDDTAKQPAQDVIRRIAAVFESADGRPLGSATITRGQLDAGGQFASYQLPAGQYYLRISNPPPDWTLKSAMLGGRDVSNVPLSLDRDVSGLVITFTNRSAELSGRVQSGTGAADATATVLIFPAESASWIDYGANPPRLRAVRVDEDANYRTVGLPAGDYLVVAVPDDAASDWQDPRTLQRLARVATAVKLADGETRSLDLRTVAVPR